MNAPVSLGGSEARSARTEKSKVSSSPDEVGATNSDFPRCRANQTPGSGSVTTIRSRNSCFMLAKQDGLIDRRGGLPSGHRGNGPCDSIYHCLPRAGSAQGRLSIVLLKGTTRSHCLTSSAGHPCDRQVVACAVSPPNLPAVRDRPSAVGGCHAGGMSLTLFGI